METSRFELDIPADAERAEAAAIASAIGAHLTDRELAAEGPADEDSWQGRQWAFAGKIESTGGCSVRVARDAPTDGWTAAGRTDRF